MEDKTEGKEILANERTFMEWIDMSITLGGIGLGLMGLSFSSSKFVAKNSKKYGSESHPHLAQLIGMILTPVALIFGIYGIYLYDDRRHKVHYKKADDGFTHRRMPIFLGFVVVCALTAILILDLFY